MPIHDWTRVLAGGWHGFHLEWLGQMRHTLNRGLLPPGYYADPEQRAGRYEAGVLTLEEAGRTDPPAGGNGAVATLAAPALSRTLAREPEALPGTRRRTLAVRREDNDRLVALIEVASPGNKDRGESVAKFAAKAADAVAAGVHVSIVDLFPPTRHDAPGGLVGAAGRECGFEQLELPADKRLCVASIEAGDDPKLHAEPLAVGDALPDLPVCLSPGRWVPVPLAATYAEAWAGTPAKYRRLLEAA